MAFDTGAAVTCMNRQSFKLAFEHSKSRKISVHLSCVAASGDKMSSLRVFKVDLLIKEKKFTPPVNMVNELNENIIGIHFIHCHQLTYDVISRQVKFAGSNANSTTTLKQTILLAMTLTVIKAKYRGTCKPNATMVK